MTQSSDTDRTKEVTVMECFMPRRARTKDLSDEYLARMASLAHGESHGMHQGETTRAVREKGRRNGKDGWNGWLALWKEQGCGTSCQSPSAREVGIWL